MIGLALGWLIAGAMVLAWLLWLTGLILVGAVARIGQPPHGARCLCERCIREQERLARLPTPPPLPKTRFATPARWAAYENHRQTLIARKAHWGLSPAQVNPHPALATDPEPAWWFSSSARIREQAYARHRARLQQFEIEDIQRRLSRRQPVTPAELEKLWPQLFH